LQNHYVIHPYPNPNLLASLSRVRETDEVNLLENQNHET
jgi:hypothetical protein